MLRQHLAEAGPLRQRVVPARDGRGPAFTLVYERRELVGASKDDPCWRVCRPSLPQVLVCTVAAAKAAKHGQMALRFQACKITRKGAVKMSEPTESKIESLVLEHLRYIRAKVDKVDVNVSELRGRIGHLEEQTASLYGLFAGLSTRLDRFDARLDHIEKRLDIAA